jgi:flagellar motor component MotA
MKHFIETVKENPWHVTLGAVMVMVLLISTLVFFFVHEPRIFMFIFGAVITVWAIRNFCEFMDHWDRRRKAFKDYEDPEYKKLMYRDIQPSRYKRDRVNNKRSTASPRKDH